MSIFWGAYHEGVDFADSVNVLSDISQPVGTIITNGNNVELLNKTAFVDYGKLNPLINNYNGNAENVIPTWLDYEKYNKFALDGDLVLTLNEFLNAVVFKCDMYFSKGYDKSYADVIVAFYDGDNRLVQMKYTAYVVDVRIEVSIDLENKSYTDYKVIILDSLGTLSPLRAAK